MQTIGHRCISNASSVVGHIPKSHATEMSHRHDVHRELTRRNVASDVNFATPHGTVRSTADMRMRTRLHPKSDGSFMTQTPDSRMP
ncbi:hypothetical protein PBR20603_04243 [Pandoraea bronchicola]|uniref:Uncharacterized protein n=1 Tax=Pandoraea bronchicola TaxID=2508287 RepID=A0A5E5BYR0_9BURK|nr:hypothetical protein PBR20603_04243 [Pandoraea bronchicola]